MRKQPKKQLPKELVYIVVGVVLVMMAIVFLGIYGATGVIIVGLVFYGCGIETTVKLILGLVVFSPIVAFLYTVGPLIPLLLMAGIPPILAAKSMSPRVGNRKKKG